MLIQLEVWPVTISGVDIRCEELLYLPKKKQYRLTTNGKKAEMQFSRGFDLERFAHLSKQQSSTRPIWCL